MAKATHYSPRISRFLVSALYHEAKRRHIPMTKLTDELLHNQLAGSQGWIMAQETRIAENPSTCPASIR